MLKWHRISATSEEFNDPNIVGLITLILSPYIIDIVQND